MIKFEYELDNIDEVAKKLIKDSITKVFVFKGEMGSGKTTLISAIINELGGGSEASSPSFSIVNEYEIKDGIAYHFDFYRINKPHEALDIGIHDYFESGHWNFIEWPEKIELLLPKQVTVISLGLLSKNRRQLKCIKPKA